MFTKAMLGAWSKTTRDERFERLILPHLDSAYNLARYMTGNDQDAEDIVQEAYMRALNAFDTFSEVNSAAWILTIVRNTGYNWLKKNQRDQTYMTAYDDTLQSDDEMTSTPAAETPLLLAEYFQAVSQALAGLPLEFREVIVLRELEDCSYKEIAEILGIPQGTVTSRLSRGRRQLLQNLAQQYGEEVTDEL